MKTREPRTLAEVETLLKRLFKSSVLQRMPKTRSDAEVVLSLLAATLDPQRNYSERELNSHLCDWLAGIADPISLDHVSVRRYLIDASVVLRQDDGAAYRANQAVINRNITPDARAANPAEIFKTLATERALRARRARPNN